VVVHGVDDNGNGQYDMAGAGASELNPAVPAEATDPAACGLLKEQHTGPGAPVPSGTGAPALSGARDAPAPATRHDGSHDSSDRRR